MCIALMSERGLRRKGECGGVEERVRAGCGRVHEMSVAVRDSGWWRRTVMGPFGRGGCWRWGSGSVMDHARGSMTAPTAVTSVCPYRPSG